MTRALVTYATKHGGTADIGEAVADGLRTVGVEVDARDAIDVKDVAGFDAVVVGSALYMNKWQSAAIDVLKRLESCPGVAVWMFSSGPTGGDAKSDAKAAEVLAAQPPAPGDAGKLATRLGVRGHVTFGGRIDESMTSFLERWMPRGDWRDMDAARAWGAAIGTVLTDEP